jgi:carboxylesterase type B
MAPPEVHHANLNATFQGIQRDDQQVPVHQFLGIKYASVLARFERAKPVNDFAGAVVDATKYGYAGFTIFSTVPFTDHGLTWY